MTILLFFGALAAAAGGTGCLRLVLVVGGPAHSRAGDSIDARREPSSVGALVIGQSAVLVVAGLAVGLVIVRLAESALTRVVFGVTTSDATALVTASALLLVAAIIACVPPALRAMRVESRGGVARRINARLYRSYQTPEPDCFFTRHVAIIAACRT